MTNLPKASQALLTAQALFNVMLRPLALAVAMAARSKLGCGGGREAAQKSTLARELPGPKLGNVNAKSQAALLSKTTHTTISAGHHQSSDPGHTRRKLTC